MPISDDRLAPPVTHGMDVDNALSTLSYREMIALARMFERWALTEEELDPARRARLIEMSSDCEAVAAYAGADWQAREPEPPSLLAFMARKEIETLGEV
jgi:hypothetical protein